MTDTISMRDRILNAAERRIRDVGFNAVSFRDLANDVGVKSASIHYHFPQKEDLGSQLVENYKNRFVSRLDDIDIDNLSPKDTIKAFTGLYGEALVIGESVCLCAILGAEVNSLPDRVKDSIQTFFTININWLDKVNAKLTPKSISITPIEIISSLEGAMIVSNVMKNRAAFDVTAKHIASHYK